MNLVLSENKKFLIIESCTEAEYKQLKLSLTKKIEGWRFHPLVKKGVWDGTICFVKGNRIPSGLWKEVRDVCNEFGFEYNVTGVTRLFNKHIDEEEFMLWCDDFFADLPFKPRYYQIDAAYKILKYRRCLAELATSAGKTLISYIVMAYLLKELQYKKILMIVPNVSLVLQSSGDFEEYNNDKLNLKIQQVYAGAKIKKDSNIVVGTFQSLVKMDQEFFDQFDVVFVDETHKANSNSIQKILDKMWHCDYRFGLSGTIAKKDTLSRLSLMSSLGPLVVQVKASLLQEEGYIANCHVTQIMLNYATESQREAFSNLHKKAFDRQKIFGLEQRFINESEKRLDWICDFIDKIATKNTLVLFHRIEYGEKIYDILRNKKNNKVYFIDGSTKADFREEYRKRMETNNDVILVASYGTLSTGVSIKTIYNIVFVESFKSDIIIKQSIGRGLRKNENKDSVEIYDIVDDIRCNEEGHKWQNYIYRHGIERRRIYEEESFPYDIRNIRIE